MDIEINYDDIKNNFLQNIKNINLHFYNVLIIDFKHFSFINNVNIQDIINTFNTVFIMSLNNINTNLLIFYIYELNANHFSNYVFSINKSFINDFIKYKSFEIKHKYDNNLNITYLIYNYYHELNKNVKIISNIDITNSCSFLLNDVFAHVENNVNNNILLSVNEKIKFGTYFKNMLLQINDYYMLIDNNVNYYQIKFLDIFSLKMLNLLFNNNCIDNNLCISRHYFYYQMTINEFVNNIISYYNLNISFELPIVIKINLLITHCNVLLNNYNKHYLSLKKMYF
jgi:hypothetical protein